MSNQNFCQVDVQIVQENGRIITRVLNRKNVVIFAKDVTAQVLPEATNVFKRAIKNLMRSKTPRQNPLYYAQDTIKYNGLRIQLTQPESTKTR